MEDLLSFVTVTSSSKVPVPMKSLPKTVRLHKLWSSVPVMGEAEKSSVNVMARGPFYTSPNPSSDFPPAVRGQ